VLLQPSDTGRDRGAGDVDDDEGDEAVGLGQPPHQCLAARVLPPRRAQVVAHRLEHQAAQPHQSIDVAHVRAP